MDYKKSAPPIALRVFPVGKRHVLNKLVGISGYTSSRSCVTCTRVFLSILCVTQAASAVSKSEAFFNPTPSSSSCLRQAPSSFAIAQRAQLFPQVVGTARPDFLTSPNEAVSQYLTSKSDGLDGIGWHPIPQLLRSRQVQSLSACHVNATASGPTIILSVAVFSALCQRPSVRKTSGIWCTTQIPLVQTPFASPNAVCEPKRRLRALLGLRFGYRSKRTSVVPRMPTFSGSRLEVREALQARTFLLSQIDKGDSSRRSPLLTKARPLCLLEAGCLEDSNVRHSPGEPI
jgi:hypothetical protein